MIGRTTRVGPVRYLPGSRAGKRTDSAWEVGQTREGPQEKRLRQKLWRSIYLAPVGIKTTTSPKRISPSLRFSWFVDGPGTESRPGTVSHHLVHRPETCLHSAIKRQKEARNDLWLACLACPRPLPAGKVRWLASKSLTVHGLLYCGNYRSYVGLTASHWSLRSTSQNR
jgi:hypothetical protein